MNRSIAFPLLLVGYLFGCSPSTTLETQSSVSAPLQTTQAESPLPSVSPAPSSSVAASPSPTESLPSDRFVILKGKEIGARVQLKNQPSPDGETVDYGKDGGSVMILEQVQGEDGFTWYKVEYSINEVVGWVRSDSVDLD